jgi:hypothetical protein
MEAVDFISGESLEGTWLPNRFHIEPKPCRHVFRSIDMCPSEYPASRDGALSVGSRVF